MLVNKNLHKILANFLLLFNRCCLYIRIKGIKKGRICGLFFISKETDYLLRITFLVITWPLEFNLTKYAPLANPDKSRLFAPLTRTLE